MPALVLAVSGCPPPAPGTVYRFSRCTAATPSMRSMTGMSFPYTQAEKASVSSVRFHTTSRG